MGMSFFAMPLAQTWLAIPMFKPTDSICSLQATKVMCNVAPGQALLSFDHCPEKRDESNPHTIGIGWLPLGPELMAERKRRGHVLGSYKI